MGFSVFVGCVAWNISAASAVLHTLPGTITAKTLWKWCLVLVMLSFRVFGFRLVLSDQFQEKHIDATEKKHRLQPILWQKVHRPFSETFFFHTYDVYCLKILLHWQGWPREAPEKNILKLWYCSSFGIPTTNMMMSKFGIMADSDRGWFLSAGKALRTTSSLQFSKNSHGTWWWLAKTCACMEDELLLVLKFTSFSTEPCESSKPFYKWKCYIPWNQRSKLEKKGSLQNVIFLKGKWWYPWDISLLKGYLGGLNS